MGSMVGRPCGSLGSGVCQPCDLGKSHDVSALKNEDNNLHHKIVPLIK